MLLPGDGDGLLAVGDEGGQLVTARDLGLHLQLGAARGVGPAKRRSAMTGCGPIVEPIACSARCQATAKPPLAKPAMAGADWS